jgi:CubicO group peptidase (beta-lactamase class C family)
MKKLFILIVIAVSGMRCFAQQDLSTTLDSMLTIYSNCNKFNGSVLIAKAGKILLEKGYGYKNVAGKTRNDATTIFQVGSITKEFTATVILKLLTQKRLSLQDHIGKYFPGFPSGDSITIKNLLTHTSGIFNYTDVFDFWKQSNIPATEQMVLDTLRSKKLLFSPGTKFSYSNSNYMLLAYIIRKVTGEPYETVVRNLIFKQLGMIHSGFDFTHLKNAGKATGYWNFSAAGYTEGPPNDSSEFIGSGSMYSSVGDLYKWHRALQNGKVLDKTILAFAYKPAKGPYGCGWELDSTAGKETVGHQGRMFGFEALMRRVPADDIFIILLNNHSDGPWLDSIARITMAILYNQPYSLPESPLRLSQEKLARYAGTFGADGHTFEVRLIDGHLFGVEKEHFLVFDVSMDANGRAIEMFTINPRGMRLTLKKLSDAQRNSH